MPALVMECPILCCAKLHNVSKSNMLQEANIESIKDIIYFAINANITLILFPNRDHLRLQSKEHETLSNLGQLDDKHD